MSDSIALRTVTDEDEPFLRRVYASTREAEMAIVRWTDDQKAVFLDMQYRAQRISYRADYPESEHSVIERDGEPVGRIWVDRNDEEIRLIDIAILPDHRGQGIGSALLSRLLESARQARVPLRHAVLKTNTNALRFYQRLGFRVYDDIATHVFMEWAP